MSQAAEDTVDTSVENKWERQPGAEPSKALGSIPVGLAHLIHEITNPLANLSIALQLVTHRIAKSSGNGDPLTLTILEEMKQEIHRMHLLVASLRSDVRGLCQYNVTFEPFDLTVLCNEVLDSEAPQYQARGIRVHRDLAAGLPRIRGNEELIRQALLNLLKNAVEAMAEGGTLSVRADSQNNSVILEIIDTGVGIPPGLELFAPFATSKPDGMGLGLTIAHNIVKIHGGKITCTSRPAKGSTFCVMLPRAVPREELNADREEEFGCLCHGPEIAALSQDTARLRGGN